MYQIYSLNALVDNMPCSYGENFGKYPLSADVAKVSNISADGLFKKDYEKRSFRETELKKLLVEKDDLLVVKSSGSKANILSGKTAICTEFEDGQLVASNFLMRLKPRKNLVYPRYLWYVLNSQYSKNYVKKIVGTTTYPNLKWTLYGKHPISLPSLPEQKHISTILDHADAIRRKNREILEKYNQLAQSVFVEMFGDPNTNPHNFPVGKIRDLVENINYGTSAKSSDNGQYQYLRMNNITYNGEIELSDLKYIDLPIDQAKKYIVKNGDLLFNRTNSKELVGKTAVFKASKEMVIAGYLIRVRTNSKANPDYISGYLNSNHGKLTLRSMCKSIIGMANINAQEFQNITIIIPPIELQNTYSNIIYQIDAQKEQIRLSISKSEELFQSLLQRAFRGEL